MQENRIIIVVESIGNKDAVLLYEQILILIKALLSTQPLYVRLELSHRKITFIAFYSIF